MKKLKKRFGGEELAETAQARYNQACQEPRESLEMWADRVQILVPNVLVPKSLHDKGKNATICVVNITDGYRVLKKGKKSGKCLSYREGGTCDQGCRGVHE